MYGTLVVPKIKKKNKKYRIWAFQCRVDHLNNFPRSKLTKLGTFMILFNFKVHTKM